MPLKPRRPRPLLPARPLLALLAWVIALGLTITSAAGASNFLVFLQTDNPGNSQPGSLRSAIEGLNAQSQDESFINFELGIGRPVLLQGVLDDIQQNVELVADPLFVTSVEKLDPDEEDEFEILRVSKGTTVLDGVGFSGGDFRVGIDPTDGADAILNFRYDETQSVDVSDDIHGLGGLVKEGAGDLFLSGINDFAGTLEIVEGRVFVDEEGLPGDAEVKEDAILQFAKFDTNLEGEDATTPERYGGVITGEGLVQKTGVHDLTLESGASLEQTGGTEVLEGRLIAAPASIPGDVAMSRDAILHFDVQAGTATWAGSATGDGGMQKSGTGVLVLEGVNRPGGGLDLQDGTIQGAADNLPRGIVVSDTARLTFEQPTDATYGGAIAGEGQVIKQGSGTLTLTANNGWTGLTTINEGRLRGSVSAIPSDVSIAAAGTLEFDQPDTGTFAEQLSGAGSLVKSGAGTLNLPNSQPAFAGPVVVEAGTLQFSNSALLPGSLTVDRAASARGEGGVNGLLDLQGSFEPGAGLDTRFNAQGGAILGAGSTLEVQVQNDGGARQSLLEVSGATTLEGGTVSVEVLPGDYSAAPTFDVLTSTAGITETGTPTTAPLYAFVEVSLQVANGAGPGSNPQALRVTVRDSGANAIDFAETTNQAQVAEALDEMLAPGNSTPEVAEVRRSLTSVTADEVPDVLDQMSAASLSMLVTQRLGAGRRFSRSISRRFTAGRYEDSPPAPPRLPPPVFPTRPRPEVEPASDTPQPASPMTSVSTLPPVSSRGPLRDPAPSEGGVGLWFDAFGVFGRIDGGAETDDVATRLYGGSMGVDYRNRAGQWLPEGQQLRFGAAFDYTRAAPFGDAGRTRNQADLYQVAGHVSWTRGALYAGTVGRYAYANGSSERQIAFGDIADVARGEFSGQDGGIYAEAGGRYGFGRRMVAQPWVGFEWTRLNQNAFIEEGAPALDLEVDSLDIDSLRTFVGARLSALLELDGRYGMEPELRIGWAHEFGDIGREAQARFTGALVGARFTSIGAETTRDEALIGAGYTMRVARDVAIALDYDARLGANQNIHDITASLYVQW